MITDRTAETTCVGYSVYCSQRRDFGVHAVRKPEGLLLLVVLVALPAWCAGADDLPPLPPQPAPEVATIAEAPPLPPDIVAPPPEPRLYGALEGLALKRDASRDRPFAALDDNQHIVLGTGDLDFEFRGGARGTVGYALTPAERLEFSHFAVSSWSEMAAVRDPDGNLFSPFTDFGDPVVDPLLDNNTFAAISYLSTLSNIELHLRCPMPMPTRCGAASYLVGMRYTQIAERFAYYSESAAAANRVVTRTGNHLVGPQIGALFQIFTDPRWRMDFDMKGAICNNDARQNTWYTRTIGGGAAELFEGSRRKDVTSFVGDISLTFVYHVTPTFTTRVGYQAMWVTGLALGSENFESNSSILELGPADLVHSGVVVYHGPHIGFSLVW